VLAGAVETRTNAAGAFAFSALKAGSYALSAEKSGLRSRVADVVLRPRETRRRFVWSSGMREAALPIPAASRSSATQAMEFEDKPNFTIAGVTDWTAAGAMGSVPVCAPAKPWCGKRSRSSRKTGVERAASSESSGSESMILKASCGERLAGAPGTQRQTTGSANHLLARRYAEAIPLLKTACTLDPGIKRMSSTLALAFKGAGDLAQSPPARSPAAGAGKTADSTGSRRRA